MKALSNASGAVEEQRNERGQWVAGVSGNPGGRPRKKAAGPKSLTDQLADAMMEKVSLIDADGKQKMVPIYEAVARKFAQSLPDLKVQQLMPAMRWMQELQVFNEMSKRAGNQSNGLTVDETRERVAAMLADLKERYGRRE